MSSRQREDVRIGGPGQRSTAPQCFKCWSDVAIIATREGPKKSYCVSCFLDFCHRTVRDSLFRDCLLPPDMPVVLCVSGGANSMAMLHLLGVLRQTNMMRGGTGKIMFDFRVLHLTEEGVVTDLGSEDANHEAIAATLRMFASSETPVGGIAGGGSLVDAHGIVVKSMRSIFSEILADASEDADISAETSAVHHHNNIFPISPCVGRRACPTDLEEEYLVRKRTALTYAARKYCCHSLSSRCTTQVASSPTPLLMVFGDNAVVACTRALGDLVRGRGASIPSGSAIRSRIQGGAYAMRPLRGLLPKEIIMYCKLCAIPRFTLPTPTTVSGVFGGKSVNRLLESFITTLMATFPSTPFNVLNSVTKLAPVNEHNPHRLPTHLPPGSREASADNISVVSSASSERGQVKVILTKASQANILAVRAIAQEDEATRSEQTQLTCAVCNGVVSSSVEDGPAAGVTPFHSVLQQRFGRSAAASASPHDADGIRVCYGCSALCEGIHRADGSAVVRDLLRTGLFADEGPLRKLSRAEVEASISDYLLE